MDRLGINTRRIGWRMALAGAALALTATALFFAMPISDTSTSTVYAAGEACTVNTSAVSGNTSGTLNANNDCVGANGQILNGPGSQVWSNGRLIKNTDSSGNTTNVSSTNEWCDNFSTCITFVVYIFTVGAMSVFAYVGSWVFSVAVQLTLNSTAYSLDFLTIGWTAVRDISNMAFIFILIYIAVMIILHADTHGTMRTLAWVIAMALLINFSFFITRIVIDAGNILAVQFYNAIPTTRTLEQTAGGSGTPATIASVSTYLPGTNGGTKDLTASIMGAIQVQNILSDKSFKEYTANNNFLVNIIMQSIVFIAVGAFLAMLAFAFLTVGFKFIIRTVVLWMAIIGAPLAFAARAFGATHDPSGSGHKVQHQIYDLWFKWLLGYAFYPAIFLFMFIIINTLMLAIGGCNVQSGACGEGQGLVPGIFGGANAAGPGGLFSQSGWAAIGAAIANVAIRMGIVLVMFYYVIKIADMIVSEGTGVAVKGSNWVGRRLGGITYGAAGMAGRYTMGWTGRYAAKSGALRNMAAQKGLTGLVGSGLFRVASRAGKASYDVRGIPGFRQGVIDLAGDKKYHGGDTGKPQEGGYQASFEKRVKRATDFADRLKKVDQADIEKARKKFLDNMDPAKKQQIRAAIAALENAENTVATAKETLEDAKETANAARDALRADPQNADRKRELKEAQEAVQAAQRDVKTAQGAMGAAKDRFKTDVEDKLKKVEDEVKQATGQKAAGVFADTITQRSLRNLGGITSAFGAISQAHLEAKAKIRGGEEDLLKRFKNLPTPPPAAPAPAAAAPAAAPLTRKSMEEARTQGKLTERTNRLLENMVKELRSSSRTSRNVELTPKEQRRNWKRSLEAQGNIASAVQMLSKSVVRSQEEIADAVRPNARDIARETGRVVGDKIADAVASMPTRSSTGSNTNSIPRTNNAAQGAPIVPVSTGAIRSGGGPRPPAPARPTPPPTPRVDATPPVPPPPPSTTSEGEGK